MGTAVEGREASTDQSGRASGAGGSIRVRVLLMWLPYMVLGTLLVVGLSSVLSPKPRVTVEWRPDPFDPPIQYAYVGEDASCEPFPRADDEDAEPVMCAEWRLRSVFKEGEYRHDSGLHGGGGCGDDGTCWEDVEFFDAVSTAQVDDGSARSMPLLVSPDGHHLAYFSKTRRRFVGWDLPAARLLDLSPKLDAWALDDFRSLHVSPDGGYFAVAFGGPDSRVLLTETSLGRTTTIRGFCGVIGVSGQAMGVLGCSQVEQDDPDEEVVTLIDTQGKVLGKWTGSYATDGLSPNGRVIVEIRNEDTSGKDVLVIHDARTGRVVKRHPLRLLPEENDAYGYGWLDDYEYVVEAETPEGAGSFGFYAVDVRTGKSHRIRDLPLNAQGEGPGARFPSEGPKARADHSRCPGARAAGRRRR
ncbi:hypothetical protein [Microtetraspora glauca]|uniref:WD40 repeat domain-containing protein n=1 Tax=Microtetraspora glauca TaxID=1996 RepID=A0ABV3GQY0_MICGL